MIDVMLLAKGGNAVDAAIAAAVAIITVFPQIVMALPQYAFPG